MLTNMVLFIFLLLSRSMNAVFGCIATLSFSFQIAEISLLDYDSSPILRQGYEVSVKELDSLLSLLAEKKRTLKQQEAETNMQIMLDFLHCLRNQKLGELNEVPNLLHSFLF